MQFRFKGLEFVSFVKVRRMISIVILIYATIKSFSFFAYQKKSCRQVKKIWLCKNRFIAAKIFNVDDWNPYGLTFSVFIERIVYRFG